VLLKWTLLPRDELVSIALHNIKNRRNIAVRRAVCQINQVDKGRVALQCAKRSNLRQLIDLINPAIALLQPFHHIVVTSLEGPDLENFGKKAFAKFGNYQEVRANPRHLGIGELRNGIFSDIRIMPLKYIDS
jgi:hypothetical protein